MPRVTGRVPNVGVRLSLESEGRSLDNRPAGHTDRGAPVGIRSAAVGRLRPILSARFKGSQTPIFFLQTLERKTAAGMTVSEAPEEGVVSAQFQGGEADEGQHHRDDPEAHHHGRFLPALLLEVMVQRGHAKHALARHLE